jgi:cytochrome c peroxidase
MAQGIDPVALNTMTNPVGVLSPMEYQGFRVFKDKGKCANCHTLTNLVNNPNVARGQTELLPVLSDFSYHNLGIPKNWNSPRLNLVEFNPAGQSYIDLGLATNPAYTPGTPEYLAAKGKFKTPTLRNIARTTPYGHNGYFRSPSAPTADPIFNSLMMIVHFYSTRDVDGQGWPMTPMAPGPGFTPWPLPEVTDNLNTADMGNLMLLPDEGMALVAFLMTLTDGFAPLP